MDAPKQARVLNRNRSADPSQPQRGDRQIVLPMTREQFDENWHDSSKMRKIVDAIMAKHPELFPECLLKGYAFHGFARASKKMDGQRLRKIRAGLQPVAGVFGAGAVAIHATFSRIGPVMASRAGGAVPNFRCQNSPAPYGSPHGTYRLS